ncbi:MAG: hypothetical protein WBE50_10205 [Methyloceanibacter sp.]
MKSDVDRFCTEKYGDRAWISTGAGQKNERVVNAGRQIELKILI